ncbi:MAG: hypothetical protein H6716_27040 [Polyangiaceae bacterium]|nr:hypothetical protein [Polyangiaceae bacterium]
MNDERADPSPASSVAAVRHHIAERLREAVMTNGGAPPATLVSVAWLPMDTAHPRTLEATLCRLALELVAGHELVAVALVLPERALPDVVADLGGAGLAPELLRWALESWASALGRRIAASGPSLLEAHALLGAWRERATASWPLPVAHPLDRLVDHLGNQRPVAAYLFLRDTAEGVVRVMWSALLWDVLTFLEDRPDGLAGLDDRCAASCRMVLDHMVGGAFSMGAAVYQLFGRDAKTEGLLAVLGPQLVQGSLSAVLATVATPTKQPSALEKALRNLADWRNADLGHGTLGREERLVELLGGRANNYQPVAMLASVLDALGPWLTEVQHAYKEWPSLLAARSWTSLGEEREGIPAPIAFRGRAPLLLTERFVPGGLQLRDIVGGGRQNHRYDGFPSALAERLARTRPGAAPLDLSPLEADEARVLATRLYEDRRVVTPLLSTLHRQLGRSPRWQAVVGPAGTGKSFLVRQLLDQLRESGSLPHLDGQWLALHFSAVPGAGFSVSDVVHNLNRQLSDAGAHLPQDARGGNMRLTGDADQDLAFWQALLAAPGNQALRVLVVIDGLDEMHGDLRRRGLQCLPQSGHEGDVIGQRARVVVSFRAQAELERDVLDSLGEFEIIDLQSFYESPEGEAALLAYLKKRHPRLPYSAPLGSGGRSLAREIVARAERRFLWVFHLARGLEVGFLDLAAAPTNWPTANAFYERYLAWLEARTDHHPGYVGTLRRVLLTLAISPSPVNDRTLLWLLDGGPESSRDAEQDAYRAWLRPVLDDLSDFLLRFRADAGRHDLAAADRIAAAIVWRDAQRVPMDAMVRRVAHRTLTDYLQSDNVNPAWAQARDRARTELAARLAHGLAALSRENAETVAAPLRYVQAHALPVIANVHGPEAMAAQVGTFLAVVPVDFSVIPLVWRWTAALSAVVAVLDSSRPNDMDRGIHAYLLGRLGSALASNQEARDAVRVHRQEVLICQTLAGLGEHPDQEGLSCAVAQRRSAVRDLSNGLNRLGSALKSCQEAQEAVLVHRREVRMCEALAGLAEDPDDEALSLAVAERRGAVRDLSIGLSGLGSALKSCQETREAVGVHRQEVRLWEALAGLGVDPDEGELSRVAAEQAGALRELAIGLGSLGSALRSNHEAQEAVQVHRREVRMFQALAGLHDDLEEGALLNAVEEHTRELRDLSIGLSRLGSALKSNREVQEAVEVHRREVRIKQALAGLGEHANDETLKRAVVERTSAVRELAIGLGRLGSALRSNEEVGEAIAVHRREVSIKHALVGLDEELTGEVLLRAVSEQTSAVRDLALGLHRLGVVLWGSSDGLAALERAHELFRALAEWSPQLARERDVVAGQLSEIRTTNGHAAGGSE